MGRDDMVDLVGELALAARRTRPGFLLIGQNAEPLLERPRYRAAIDAVSKESLLTGLQTPGSENSVEQIAWSMKYLLQAQRAKLTILTIEYPASSDEIERYRVRNKSMGFKPFFGQRLLDRLP